ncbi:hypothetical protein D3C73_1325690 [compost metagenome]
MVPRSGGIQADQAHGMLLYHPVERRMGVKGQVGMRGKRRQQVLTNIVIAGHEVERHVQTRQLCREQGVFIRAAEIHEIAADHHNVGTRLAGIQVIDRTAQRAQAVDHTVGEFVIGFEVQIADLRNKKRAVQNKGS